jgi:DNA-binding LytR/AlgR family response regulator
MNILIVEDEIFAFKKLKSLIEECILDINFIAHSESIIKAIDIIENNNKIDLAFFDIQLNDGISFDIFEKTNVYFPVVFTTAYNEYALKAFKHNSIDYLLKPIDKIELKSAINKYNKYWNNNSDLSVIKEVKEIITTGYKTRFTTKVGEHIKLINANDICLFYSFEKATFIKTNENRNYNIDYSLESLMPILNSDIFFKINRKEIININSIKDIISYSNSRLKIKINLETESELIVAREKVKLFKQWLDK